MSVVLNSGDLSDHILKEWLTDHFSKGKNIIDDKFGIYYPLESDPKFSRSERAFIASKLEDKSENDLSGHKHMILRVVTSIITKDFDELQYFKIGPSLMCIFGCNDALTVYLSEKSGAGAAYLSFTHFYATDQNIQDKKDNYIYKDKINLLDGYLWETSNMVSSPGILNAYHVAIDPDGYPRYHKIHLHADLLNDILDINYNKNVSDVVHQLTVMLENDLFVGKMLFLNGPPGTGKTYLLKSFISHMQDKFCPVIISNPLLFLKTNAYYRVIDYLSDEKRPLMFICEDSDVIVSEEARDMYPDEFSSLANLTSGLIGTGRRDLFLFTFNRDVIKISDAFLRECRCSGNIYVGNMDSETIETFTQKHGIPNEIKAPCTLADAYANLLGFQKKELMMKKKSIGFQ